MNKKFFKLFLTFFLPIVILSSGLSAIYYFSERTAKIESVKNSENLRLLFTKSMFEDEFQSIVSDLVILSAHQEIDLLTSGSSEIDYEALTEEFYIFSKNKKKYDQVRLIDIDGYEEIRINYNNGISEIVPVKNLQSKENRYYFKDTMNLEMGEVYVSPFDLNVENGQVEVPFKPMIRFGIPIFNTSNEIDGVVIINYLGDFLLNQIERVPYETNSTGYGIIVNNDGYFLKDIDENNEWGFMLKERQDAKFRNLFPTQWKKFNESLSGQFLDDDGLFTFITIYPLSEGLKSSSDSSGAYGRSSNKLNASEYYWKIISHIPEKNLFEKIQILKGTLVLVVLLIALIVGFGSRSLALAIINRNQAENKIKKLALFDHLTELPNRQTLSDRITMSIAASKRGKKHFFVFFIDLDGFKEVNDQYGHETGDAVIIESAKRFKSCVRESDTVARLGGDEFIILLNSIEDVNDAGAIADKILSSISNIYEIEKISCSISASIGISVYPDDGNQQKDLLKAADRAMYDAKNSGKNTYKYYSNVA